MQSFKSQGIHETNISKGSKSEKFRLGNRSFCCEKRGWKIGSNKEISYFSAKTCNFRLRALSKGGNQTSKKCALSYTHPPQLSERRYCQHRWDTGCSFWDRLRNFLHKFTWIVLSVWCWKNQLTFMSRCFY